MAALPAKTANAIPTDRIIDFRIPVPFRYSRPEGIGWVAKSPLGKALDARNHELSARLEGAEHGHSGKICRRVCSQRNERGPDIAEMLRSPLPIFSR
jgi:hypothetical protein